MRAHSWLSTLAGLWVPRECKQEIDETSAGEAPNFPRCHKCSAEKRFRFPVVEYGYKDAHSHAGGLEMKRHWSGKYYVDVYARCHGEEQVLRFWAPDKAEKERFEAGDAFSVACITALPFFAGTG